MRFCPGTDLQSAQLTVENVLNCLEFRAQDVGMLSHVLYHAVDILEETHVAELIHFIMTDSLNL